VLSGYSSNWQHYSVTERLIIGLGLVVIYGCIGLLWLSSSPWRASGDDKRLSSLFDHSSSPGALRHRSTR
jgi:hypothetical protein